MQRIRRIKKRTRKINQYAAGIELTQGYWARVDAELLPLLMKYSWSAHKTGVKVYAKAHIGGRSEYMHRFIMKVSSAKRLVDHRDGNSLNNRRSNLRLASSQQNAQNSRGAIGRRKSKTRGVCKREHPRLPWRAYIYDVNGRFLHLGYFATEEEATATRSKAEKRMRGQFSFQARNAA